MTRIFISFTFLLFSTSLFSQDAKTFEKTYNKTFLETSNKNLPYAIKVADSLYKTSTKPLYKSRSLMLSATLYKQAGDIKKSIEYGLKSLSLIEGTGNYAYETKNYGFLASQYRMLKFNDQSKQYLEKAIITSSKIKNPDLANKQLGLIFQEKAFLEMDHKEYLKAITNLEKSQKYFDLVKEKESYYNISNQHLLGNNFYELNNLVKANFHYQKALEVAENEPETFLTGLIYNGLALIAIKDKDPKTAKKYIILSEEAYKNSQFLELKNEIYTTSQLYYELTNDLENLLAIQKKKDSIGEKISFKYREHITDSYNSLEKNLQKGKDEIGRKNTFIIICIFLIIIGIIYFSLFKKRESKKLQKFKQIIAALDEDKPIISANETMNISADEIEVKEDPIIEQSSVLISPKAKEKIIARLEKFENNNVFTQKNMSLPNLAAYCDTNIKYLSFVIKNYKEKDFTSYINDLRINYIIHQLKTDKSYRKFKIAALADEAGFSSPNKFATIFKSVTTLPPSVFINFLEKENKDK